jgi:putative transcription factor
MDNQDWKPLTFHKQPPKSNKTQNQLQQKGTKLDNENENFTHKKLDTSFKVAMQKARLNAKVTQKDLATRLNVKSTVINSYENGSCVPNNDFIVKIERILKCKLPRGKIQNIN